jgi:hypothetical protein
MASAHAQDPTIDGSLAVEEYVQCGTLYKIMADHQSDQETKESLRGTAIFFAHKAIDQASAAQIKLISQNYTNTLTNSAIVIAEANRCEGLVKRINSDKRAKLANFDSSLPAAFLDSALLLRSGIDDLEGLTVRQYVVDLAEKSLTDGSRPAILSWAKNENEYVLRVRFGRDVAALTFVHDLSSSSRGQYTQLLPINFKGEEVDPMTFFVLMRAR